MLTTKGDIRSRIEEIIKEKGVKPGEFADIIGVGKAVLSHILVGRNLPSIQVVIAIKRAYPSVDLNWLLME